MTNTPVRSQTGELHFRTANALTIVEFSAQSGGALALSTHAIESVETWRARVCGSCVML